MDFLAGIYLDLISVCCGSQIHLLFIFWWWDSNVRDRIMDWLEAAETEWATPPNAGHWQISVQVFLKPDGTQCWGCFLNQGNTATGHKPDQEIISGRQQK